MLTLKYSLFLTHTQPLLTSPFSHNNYKPRKTSSSSSSSCTVYAVEKGSKQFKVDPDKARDALKELDQQLESLSNKQPTPLKTKASPAPEMNFTRSEMREEKPELSGSFLSNTVVILFIFSIFYNVLFLTVIKPAIDFPQGFPTTSSTESQKGIIVQLLPFSELSPLNPQAVILYK